MTTMTAWPGRAESWLDDRGRGAWVAAMVLALILFWPVGLVLGGYMVWSGRLFGGSGAGTAARSHRCRVEARRHGFRTSGNSAFDAYKADTLDRLEREQAEFEAFLRRLRDSKDKAEFDQYLAGRSAAAGGTAEAADAEAAEAAEEAEAGAGRADPPADGDAGRSGTGRY